MTVYTVFKDFAGPIATVFAATVAVIIAFRFQKRRYIVVNNKIRFDTFNIKYKIYEDAKILLSIVLNDCHDLDHMRKETENIAKLYVSLNESRLFFSKRVINELDRFREDAKTS